MKKAIRSKDLKKKERAEQIDQAYQVRKVFELCRAMVGRNTPLVQREQGVHTLLYSALLNQENNMRKGGIEIPSDYVEDRIVASHREGSGVAPLYVMCKRCEFCRRQDDGSFRCTEFYSGPRREVYLVSEDDGCSRGLLRKEYR